MRRGFVSMCLTYDSSTERALAEERIWAELDALYPCPGLTEATRRIGRKADERRGLELGRQLDRQRLPEHYREVQ